MKFLYAGVSQSLFSLVVVGLIRAAAHHHVYDHGLQKHTLLRFYWQTEQLCIEAHQHIELIQWLLLLFEFYFKV